MIKLLATVVILSLFASPAFAQKRSEYNFNTCNYNFYGNANPMNGQGAGGGSVNFYKGVGTTADSAEKMRTGMNAAVYQQTPQKTKTWDNMGYARRSRVVNTQQRQQVQLPQQQQQYLYVPGQNNRAAQSSSGVGYQYNSSSGLATYDSGNTTTGKNP